jgi:hypothetical protein
MSFLNPWGLLGLLSLPAIAGLHLYFDRQKRVMVSSLFLWRFLDEKFQGERPRHLRMTWLLVLDLLLAILFTLAFAQPEIRLPSWGVGQGQRVILLDNSLSMLAADGDPDRLTAVKQAAIALIEAADRETMVSVFTIGGQVQLIGSTEASSRQALIQQIEAIQAAGLASQVRQGLGMAEGAADRSLPLEVVVITDGAFPLPEFGNPTFSVKWMFVGGSDNNQALISPVLEDDGDGRLVLFFQAANYAQVETTRGLEVWVDGELLLYQPILLPARSVVPRTMDLYGAAGMIEVRLTGSDLVSGDDVIWLGTPAAVEVRVAIVASNPDPIDRAVSALPDTTLTLLGPGEDWRDRGFDLVILRGITAGLDDPGVDLVIFDPPTETFVPVGADIQQVDTPLLAGVELSNVSWGYAAQVSPPGPDEVLAEAAGLPLLIQQQVGESSIVLFTPDLNSGNITKLPAFPILVGNLVEQARGFRPESHYASGAVLEFPVDRRYLEVVVIMPDGSEKVIPPGEDLLLDQTGLTGISVTARSGETVEYQFGVITGDSNESDIQPADWRNEVSFTETQGAFQPREVTVSLAPWILLLALIILGVEAWRAWR